MKLKKLLFMTTVFSVAMAGTAFAGTWKNGNGENQHRWWYDFGNGAYAANGWHWIDGNNDGVAECYYFDQNGWMLENTTTPDGHTVNANGVWTVDGVVQVQSAAAADSKASVDYSWILNADGQVNYDVFFGDYMEYIERNNGIGINSLKSNLDQWAEESERGKVWKRLFETYQIPYDIESRVQMSGNGTFKVTHTTPAGKTAQEYHSAGAALWFMVQAKYDCMAINIGWYSSIDENGAITVELTGEMA